MDQKIESKILELTNKSDWELYVEIANDLPKNLFFGVSEDDNEQKEIIARNWIAQEFQSIQKYVCKSEKLKRYALEERTFNRTLIISMIGDLFITQFSKNFPAPFAVATLIVREGLASFCSNEWTE